MMERGPFRFAKKTKPESMLNAYNKYKENAAKPQKTRGPKGERKSLQEKFTYKYEEFTTFVTGMDFGTLDTPERNDLISRIEDLKKTADILIDQIKTAPDKITPPPKAPKPKKEKVIKEKKPTAAKEKRKPVAKPATKKTVQKEKKAAPKKEVKKTSTSAKPKTKK